MPTADSRSIHPEIIFPDLFKKHANIIYSMIVFVREFTVPPVRRTVKILSLRIIAEYTQIFYSTIVFVRAPIPSITQDTVSPG